MDMLLERIRKVVPGLTSGRLHAMAGAVWERAQDLEQWGDEDDYDDPSEYHEQLAWLEDAARVLGVLAQVMEEAEEAAASGAPS